ncbi:MAG: phospholipase [Flavobacteriales bacterium]|nr:phospholipase [Flavobacteriales bacterium]
MKLKAIHLFLFITFIWLGCNAQQLQYEPTSNLSYIVKEGGTKSNLLILIHRYGSNEKDLFSFANRFPKTTVICVRGPITRSGNSFCWYDIQFRNNGEHERDLQQAVQSETMLLQFISAMEDKYETTNTIIGGFSQGAIISAKIALSHPESVDGIICISGMLLSTDLTPNIKLSKQYKSIKAFYSHGTRDNVISIDKGRR